MSISADNLLKVMQAGGKLEKRWRGGIIRQRRRVILTYPDGEQRYIQDSPVSALVHRGYLRSREWSGKEYVYELTEKALLGVPE